MSIDREHRHVFAAALVSSLLLMASGLFLGTIGIDDELNATKSSFPGIGRGLWGQELVTILLPGQMGISFAPILVGCCLYALSVTMLVRLWNITDHRVSLASAAIMGCFPYFASMMSFDAVQVAYPLAFVAITSSVFLIYTGNSTRSLTAGAASFAIAFSLYQGVATTFATAFASVAVARIALAGDPAPPMKLLVRAWLPKGLAVAITGGLLYLGSDRLVRYLVPHSAWSSEYRVAIDLAFNDPERLARCMANIRSLTFGGTGDLPFLSSVLLMGLLLILASGIVGFVQLQLWKRLVLLLALAVSVFILPFWLIFVQSMALTPRSAVGLGALYAVTFAILASQHRRLPRWAAQAVAAIWCTQFVFLGNEMYYCQHLTMMAEQSTAARLAARIDAVAVAGGDPIPASVVLIGTYEPAHAAHARFSTLGSSPLSWRDGAPYRQARLLALLGVDGYRFDATSQLRDDASRHVLDHAVPAWPDPRSVFRLNRDAIVVNFGLRE